MLSVVVGLAACWNLHAGGTDLETLACQAVSVDPEASASAIAALRAKGPEGLEALIRVNDAALKSWASNPDMDGDPSWKRVRAALDAVGQQHDCHVSHLYWHTDMEEAKSAAAKAGGKPILSLRMLGKLDEDCSCANSRFFRTTLYSNAEISKYLREHFILHWKSVRPVPKITVDFGDGRRIERTVTGNSAHYLLDAQGRVLDVLPGLYGPKAFLRQLTEAEAICKECQGKDDASRLALLKSYHGRQNDVIAAAWSHDVEKIGGHGLSQPSAGLQLVSNTPTARQAAVVAVGKGAFEKVMIGAMETHRNTWGQSMDDRSWAAMAALHAEDAVLDASSVALIRSKNPPAAEAAKLALTKSRVENPLVRVVNNFQRSIAEDTVRNEYLLHSRIHEWLAGSFAAMEVDALNEKVYAELFLTPSSDPWLGLVPQDTYTALDNDGLVRAPGNKRRTRRLGLRSQCCFGVGGSVSLR